MDGKRQMTKLEQTEYSIALDASGIDIISDKIAEKMKKAGVRKKDILRLRLTIEDHLVRVSQHYGTDVTVTLRMGRRFCTPYVYISYEGDEFDPISSDDSSPYVFPDMGIDLQWSYRRGINTLYFKAPYQTPKNEVFLIAAVVLALLAGFLNGFIPTQVSHVAADYILTPVSNAFMSVLGAFVRFMIFFSVISGICSIGSISDFSKMGRHLSGRMIVRTFAGTAFCIVTMIPFYKFGSGDLKEGVSQLGKIIELLFSIFPDDLLSPFIEGNTLQIIFIAVMSGSVILLLGDKAEQLRKIIKDLTLLFSHIIVIICKFLPIYIFSSLVLLIWENGSEMFIKFWKPLVLSTVILTLFVVVKVIYVSIRFKISPLKFLSVIKGTMLVALATASSAAALSDVLQINEKKLGISPKLNGFGVPFANLLIRSVVGAIFVITIYYMAEVYAVPVNIGWFVTAWIMCSILSIAAPPVPGGSLVVMEMLLTQLGIPLEGIAVAGLITLITEFTCTAAMQGIGHCEILINADDLNMLDRSKLDALRSVSGSAKQSS